MKLATLKNGTRDGQLAVVSRDLKRAIVAGDSGPTMQAALDDWQHIAPMLAELSVTLDAGGTSGAGARHVIPFDARLAHAPFPRAYQVVVRCGLDHNLALNWEYETHRIIKNSPLLN